MQRFIHPFTILLVFLAVIIMAAQPVSAEPKLLSQQTTPAPVQQIKILVIGDFSDQKHFDIENSLLDSLRKIQNSGALSTVTNLSFPPMIINSGQPGADKLLASLKITAQEMPILAVAEIVNTNSPTKILWKEHVNDPNVSIQNLSRYFGCAVVNPGPIIRAADYEPRSPGKPLSAGSVVTFTLQGMPGGKASADIGPISGIALFEEQVGLYRGRYTIAPQDKGSYPLSVTLTAPDGAIETKNLGVLQLEGYPRPTMQSIQNSGPGQWLITGTAPANSSIRVDIRSKMSFIFKITELYNCGGASDSYGRYQVIFSTNDKLSNAKGTFVITATTPSGEVIKSDEIQMNIPDSQEAYYPTPGPSFDINSLAGTWWHGRQQCWIRVTGFDSVTIRTEQGDEIPMYYWAGQLKTRGAYRLTGDIVDGGNTIRWNNGTFWTRYRR